MQVQKQRNLTKKAALKKIIEKQQTVNIKSTILCNPKAPLEHNQLCTKLLETGHLVPFSFEGDQKSEDDHPKKVENFEKNVYL